MASALKRGWVTLPCGAEILLDEGIPRRIWIGGGTVSAPAEIVAQTATITGFHVAIGELEAGGDGGDAEAALTVVPSELGHVLECLAAASARVFYDRYRKSIDLEDTDWDDEAYAQDLGTALRLCGTQWSDVDDQAYRVLYRRAMHAETEQLSHSN